MAESALLSLRQLVADEGLDQPVNLDGPGANVQSRQGEATEFGDGPPQPDRVGDELGERWAQAGNDLIEGVSRNRLRTEERAVTQQIQSLGKFLLEAGDRECPGGRHR